MAKAAEAKKGKEVPAGFKELQDLLGTKPMLQVKHALAAAALERVSALKTLRKKLTKMKLDPAEVDAELELFQGTKKIKGLLDALDVAEDEKPEADPAQRDMEDKPDVRTWDKTTDQVRELVTEIVAEHKPVAAIQTLNALEDGENQREGGSRESVLKVIASARRPLVKKVDHLKLN